MNDTCILYFHGTDWDSVPARQRYLMTAMSRHVPVVYMDRSRLPRRRVRWSSPQPGIDVIHGLVALIESLENRGLFVLAAPLARWHLRNVRRRYRRIILWAAENWLRPYRFVPHDLSVFDCIDPAFSEDPEDLRIYESREMEVLAAADLVFASADALAEQCSHRHDDVILLNNACAPGDYAPELLDAAPQPGWWPANGHPVAAYLGAMDWRVDFDALDAACRANPGVHFVLAGQISPEVGESVSRLKALPNVTIPGRISVAEGRFLLSRCTMGLIPFRLTRANDCVNPVKLYAYALLGKPIAAMATLELASRPQLVLTAGTASDFAGLISKALDRAGDGEFRSRLIEFATNNTWENRATVAMAHLSRALAAKAGRGEPLRASRVQEIHSEAGVH